MGTNFYRIPTKEKMEERRDKFISEFQKMNMEPESIENKFRTPQEDSFDWASPWDHFVDGVSIHLGKRSMGWKFCWNFHNNKYYSNKGELLEFIRKGRVVDEYGKEQEIEEFIEMALEWGQPDGLTVNEEYEMEQMKKGRMIFYGEKYWDKNIDGLRVSSSTEFS